MASKINAAKKVSMAGVPMIIANGTKAGILKGILSGETEGTLFLPREEILCSRKHWIAFAKATKGELIVDRGAEEALLKSGRSLLPTGILEVKGNFGVGDSVVVRNGQGRKLAVGMVNYPSGEMAKIKGLRSNQIEAVLGYKHDDETIHRDNLVITDELERGNEECQ
jgi:glutamate 5-kinase